MNYGFENDNLDCLYMFQEIEKVNIEHIKNNEIFDEIEKDQLIFNHKKILNQINSEIEKKGQIKFNEIL